MKYVVTGGAGFIGSSIVKLLIKKGHDVSIIDNLHTGNLSRLKEVKEKISFNKIDIRNFEELNQNIQDIDGIFHQAALTVVPESFEKPEEYYDVNVNGTKNIFKIAKKLNVKVVFASSSSIYGNVNEIPIKENFEKNPINPYGQTKVEKEKLTQQFWNDKVSIIGLRYFNVYGKGQTGSYAGVITQFMKKIDNDLPPIIYGKGNQIRDFISVEDVAKANVKSMESNISQDFLNIGTGKSISILKLAKLMIKISGKKIEPVFDKELPGDIEKSQADTTHSKEKIEWNYEIELEEGLKKLMVKESCS
ncbi:MAG: NAD-dependent epimerase/dehydratase family protein [Candidatus Nitrosopumilus sp. bin_6a]